MSSDESDKKEPSEAEGEEQESSLALRMADRDGVEAAGLGEGPKEEEAPVAGHIGVQRYVHASFFAAGILAAYLSGKLLLSAWNSLADWPPAVRSLPFLIEYNEQDRASLTLVIGAVVGLVMILRYYRRPAVRSWATDVAGELARVTWPNKDTVTNGTIVVLVAAAAATIYISLLDRLWGYLTNLVYGA
jgi:preprotein translocase SecE subunit